MDEGEKTGRMRNLEHVFEQVSRWVGEVGAIQLEYLGKKDLEIENKSSSFDLVTEVDKLSEQRLIAKVREAYPEDAILSEESGSDGNQAEYRWVIDPVDGTTNYAHGFPLFAISMALQHQGSEVLGIIYVPFLNELYHAEKGRGAFRNGSRFHVSNARELGKALLATGFPYDKATDPNNNLNYFNHLVPQIIGIRRTGSAAFDLCNVAAGRIDGYWEFKVKPWDVAAGALIVEEAGGRVEYLPDHPAIAIIAGNDHLVKLIRAELAKVDAQDWEPIGGMQK